MIFRLFKTQQELKIPNKIKINKSSRQFKFPNNNKANKTNL